MCGTAHLGDFNKLKNIGHIECVVKFGLYAVVYSEGVDLSQFQIRIILQVVEKILNGF
jgi:hypothetical protein